MIHITNVIWVYDTLVSLLRVRSDFHPYPGVFKSTSLMSIIDTDRVTFVSHFQSIIVVRSCATGTGVPRVPDRFLFHGYILILLYVKFDIPDNLFCLYLLLSVSHFRRIHGSSQDSCNINKEVNQGYC